MNATFSPFLEVQERLKFLIVSSLNLFSSPSALLKSEMLQLRSDNFTTSKFPFPILLWWPRNQESDSQSSDASTFSLTRGRKTCPKTAEFPEESTCFFVWGKEKMKKRYLTHPLTKGIFFYGTDFDPEYLPLPRRKGTNGKH